jgi:shikimate kinase
MTMAPFETISLIGMPGAGKSTVGVLLAKLAGLRFVDTDLDIQVRAGATLQEILERHDYQYLRQLEEQVLMEVALDHALVSTGGSVVYSDASMQRLKAAGPVVYLKADLTTLEQRIAGAPPRGIASDSAQDFASLYAERTPLYLQYADLIVNAADHGAEAVATDVLAKLHR